MSEFTRTVGDGEAYPGLPRNPWEVRRFEAIAEEIPEGAEFVLDIGSARHESEKRASGNLHSYLVHRTEASVRGIDILPDQVEEMQEAGYDVVVGDAETFSFEQRFDAIVAGELIEHLPNPGLFIENALDHLTPDGRIVLTTPNPDGFVFFRKALLDQSNNPTHTCWIDPANLRALCGNVENAAISKIMYLAPSGGISSILWRLGKRRAASPTYLACIEREE